MPIHTHTTSGGGGDSSVTELETWDATSDLTAKTITTAGSHTLYASDGVTARATIVVTVVNDMAAGWSVVCDASASPPIKLSGVEFSGTGSAGYINVQVEPVFSSEPDWVRDRWFAEVLYSGLTINGASASESESLRFGAAPVGSVLTDDGSNDIGINHQGGSTYVWRRETWTDSDQLIISPTAAPSSAALLLIDSRRDRLALLNGGTDFASDLTSGGTWTADTIGHGQIASSGNTGTGDYSTGLGVTLHAFSAATGDGVSIGISKIKLSVGAPRED